MTLTWPRMLMLYQMADLYRFVFRPTRPPTRDLYQTCKSLTANMFIPQLDLHLGLGRSLGQLTDHHPAIGRRRHLLCIRVRRGSRHGGCVRSASARAE